MRNIILAVVVVVALATAGVGGVFATWSDSETSPDNYIETGSLDLLVNGADDLPWGTGVPTKVNLECMVPCKIYGPFPVDVWNAGQCCEDCTAELYLHIKELCCSSVPAKPGSGYPNPYDGVISPEPELVAQYGGKVDCTEVDGIGVLGEDCTLPEHIEMRIMKDDPYTGPVIWDGKMNLADCTEIYLCDLPMCTQQTLYFWFHLQQPSEEDFGMDYIPDPGEAGYDPMHWAKWNDWPSWALMKDAVSFDMEFDLWLIDP